MEQVENSGGSAVEDTSSDAVPAQPAASSEPGESGASPERQPEAKSSANMDAFIRGVARGTPTSKPAEDEATGESTPDPSGDVEAGGARLERGPDGKFLPRRGVPKAVEEAQARIADLERQLAERDPAKIAEREALEALEQSEQADAERFRRLNELPDDHPELAEGDNYSWLQEYKRILSLSPKAAKQHRALAEQQIRAATEQMGRDQESFRESVRSEIRAVAREFGVDPEAWKAPGTTWATMTRDAVTAKTAPLEARIAELERELHSARTLGPNGLGSGRAPAAAGRSAGGAGPPSMDDWIRGRFRSNGSRG